MTNSEKSKIITLGGLSTYHAALLSRIPTKTSLLTNNSGFITGITKAMVTTALGYTPPTTNTWKAANSSQEGYVPKSTANKILRADGNGALYWGDDIDTNTNIITSVVGQTGAVTAAQIGTALTNAGYKLTDTTYTINGLLGNLPVWSATPTDTTYFVRQDTNGAASYGKVPFSTLWSYIQTKINAAGYLTSHQSLAGYLPLSGGVMTGNITMPNNAYLVQRTAATSNAVSAIMWYLGNSAPSSGYCAQIGWHNTANAIYINPVNGVQTLPYDDNTGFYLNASGAKIWGSTVLTAANLGSNLTKTMVTNALGYTPPTSDTNTHWTTRIYAGASGTAANAAATSPYIKITDDNTYRNQIRLVGGGATTVSSDASGNITISSTDTNTNTTYSASTGLSLSGTAFSVKYGTAAGTACQGNDSRLSDARVASNMIFSYSAVSANLSPTCSLSINGVQNIVYYNSGSSAITIAPGGTVIDGNTSISLAAGKYCEVSFMKIGSAVYTRSAY